MKHNVLIHFSVDIYVEMLIKTAMQPLYTVTRKVRMKPADVLDVGERGWRARGAP